MGLTSAFPYILSGVLFAVTIIVVFILRARDRRKLGLTEVQRFVMDSIDKIKSTDDAFKQDISDIERSISDRERQLTDKIQAVTAQINQIDSYSEDLARLRLSMHTYQDALAGIARLTTDADEKIKQIESDIERLSEVNKVIEGFREEISRSEQKLHDMEGTVDNLMAEALKKLDDSSAKMDQDCDSFISKLDEKIDNVSNLTVRYIGELDDKISATQVASSMLHQDGAEAIEKLIEEKRKLETEISSAKHSKADLDIKIATMEASINEPEEVGEVGEVEEPEDVPDWGESPVNRDEEEIVFD